MFQRLLHGKPEKSEFRLHSYFILQVFYLKTLFSTLYVLQVLNFQEIRLKSPPSLNPKCGKDGVFYVCDVLCLFSIC